MVIKMTVSPEDYDLLARNNVQFYFEDEDESGENIVIELLDEENFLHAQTLLHL